MTQEIVKKQSSLKKGIINLAYKQGPLFEKNPNSPTSLQQLKLVKVLEKYPKLEEVIRFK